MARWFIFAIIRKQTQGNAYWRSQRECTEKMSPHSLFFKNTFWEKKQNKITKNDVSDTWVVSSSQRKKLLRHQIYIVMRHKIFEYSFTASLPGIISVKGFFLFTLFRYQLIYIWREILFCFFFYLKRKCLTDTWNWKLLKKKKKLSKADQFFNWVVHH